MESEGRNGSGLLSLKSRRDDTPTFPKMLRARVRVYAGPFAGHEVDVIEPLRNNLIRVVVMLLDGPARLDLSVLDLVDSQNRRSRGLRKAGW